MSSDVAQPPRRVRWVLVSLLVVVVAVGGAFAAWAIVGSSGPTVGPEGVVVYNVPDLAPATTTRQGETVDGITCRKQAAEVVKYHVHVHVAVYVNGQMVRLPAGIGMTQPPVIEHFSNGTFYDVGYRDCLYWLHTHVADGIVHVEAPMKHAFTLGQFFDIWGQPLGPSQVGPAEGAVVVFENGHRLLGNPRSTPLVRQAAIQLDVGSPVVPFKAVHFKVTGGCGEGSRTCSGPTHEHALGPLTPAHH